jgi:hypothetical protein
LLLLVASLALYSLLPLPFSLLSYPPPPSPTPSLPSILRLIQLRV